MFCATEYACFTCGECYVKLMAGKGSCAAPCEGPMVIVEVLEVTEVL